MTDKLKISAFPEIVDGNVKVYSGRSYEDAVAMLCHKLRHMKSIKNYHIDDKEEMVQLIQDFLEYKKIRGNFSDDYPSMVAENPFQYGLFDEIFKVPFPAPKRPKFTFIDLFAGIGGFRIAMQNVGGECVFSSELDANAKLTYMHNFGDMPFGDITLQKTKDFIPEHFDVLCAGFPCQAFSIAGYRRGFEDTRGTLFFDVATIIKMRRPKAFFLENVKNLQSHDEGKTFAVIRSTLEDLGYKVFFKVMNSMEYANIPQNRERIFIIGFDPEQVENYADFQFPDKVKLTKTVRDCIDDTVCDEKFFYREDKSFYPELVKSMHNPNTVYQWRRQYVRENQSNVCPTLTANMGEGGHNVPLIITDRGFRKLTPKECLNFQGYPDNYTFPNITQSKCYKQAGNSVTVPLIQRVAGNMINIIEDYGKLEKLA